MQIFHSRPFFCNLVLFLKKIYVWPLGDLNSSLDPRVGARTHGAELTRLSATDLGFEVPGRAQQGILGGVRVAGTSAPEHMVPSMDSKPMAKFPLPRLLSFLPPPSRFLPLPNPPNLLNRRI